jgi:hypothetical protein
MQMGKRAAGAAARPIAVRMRAVFELDRDDIHLTVAHAALGAQSFGKSAHAGSRPAQDDALQTMIVVEVSVHRRHRQIMMGMLQLC